MRPLPPSSGNAERVRARAACLDSFRIVRERRIAGAAAVWTIEQARRIGGNMFTAVGPVPGREEVSSL